MKKGIFILSGALLLLAGCNSGNQASNIPIKPKWQGAPYRLSFGALPAKPNPSGVTLPAIKFIADPDQLERRVDLVVLVDTSSVKQASPVPDQMIMAATDISGAEGALSPDYLEFADKQLATMLSSYCMKGKVKISVTLVSSSLPLGATDDLVNAKRLSDWLPLEITYKNPHGKC